MRKISFLLALAIVFFTFSASATFAATDFPNTSTNGMIGFAGQAKSEAGASNPATTGGKNGQVIYINNLNELKNQLGDSTPKILVIEKNISASSKTVINIGSNKSLIGSYAQNKLINIHLKTTANSGNVIFQNLTFEHSASINGNDDIQLYLTAGTNYWIDHVTFAGHNYNANGSDLDKLLYIGQSADYVTISNSKFANHKYGLILGYPDDSNKNYDGMPHITIANNYFENLLVRGPGLMRYGYFHVKNNYINNFQLAYTIATNARIYSENNYFGKGSEKGGILDDKANGEFKDVGSFPAITNQKSPVTRWNPSKNYSYQVQTPEYTKEFVTKYAGSSNTTLVFGK
ncbi:pectate lyase family protein [Paenibacillus polymyxa]|uniref:pectate lyase family protein n=1 Tax=Paenibacillus polymyxa TaxID=1406 RepID=UPI002024C889|nr:pectate lyase [Paenibacillus polymyxa]MDU8675158.1 pectate lyase [Paenibacillus polymyxa]MDU8700065.1 pectate lyase [Paenibacillus polymyxa]URJ54693.1 pectate lyase [Paenibacillus polymyxa]URJ66535.1 pectate lyase [Paenibacillus polymyxa]URJ69203.1 pectate lyase [Paenibacillus polymyxa]